MEKNRTVEVEIKSEIRGWNTQSPPCYYETDGKILVELEQQCFDLNVKEITLVAIENKLSAGV